MSLREETRRTLIPEAFVAELDADILALAVYLAKRKGMTFYDFIEYLITKEATKGWSPEARDADTDYRSARVKASEA